MDSVLDFALKDPQSCLRMSMPSSGPSPPASTNFNLNCNLIRHPKGRTRSTARSGHRIVADEANLYSFRRYNPTHQPSNETHDLFGEVWGFNLVTRQWIKLSPIPAQWNRIE
ncbi:hypothetical protein BV898_11918 [Hypsibius exemplaris]|uniref:Uncharacterized protein n=1 Tax=Hypsibius exemplaris TaxID=2072580 RepID=A0A1W0WFE8_HYPEX|nr:hypothetical protein BV898_11918 [Hypsibius exemplaris]